MQNGILQNRTAKWTSSKRWKGKDNSIRVTHQPVSNGINKSWIHRRKKDSVMAKLLVEEHSGPEMLLLGFYECSLVRALLPPWSYSWVWAGEEYLARGAFLASLPTCVSVFVDSTSETTECPPQTSAAGVGSEEQQHQSRWRSGTFGMEVSRERPCFQRQKAHGYIRSHTFQGVAKHGLWLRFSHWLI